MTLPTTQIAASDFNLERLDTRRLERHVSASIEAQTNIAIFGRRGTGKTAISKQRIQAANMLEVYMNLSVFERTDLAGYPDMFAPKKDGGECFVSYLLPGMFEPMIYGDQKVVALLDEVDKADPSLWAPLLEFTQFKSINGKRFPNLQCVIMTGNLISEGGNRPSLPLLDRTEKYLVEATSGTWLAWAATAGIHPSIVQYILDHSNQLYGDTDIQDNYGSPSPRGWENSSRIIYLGEERGWDVDLITEKIAGFVGKRAGLDYKMYYTNYQVLLPLVQRIFDGKDVKLELSALSPSERFYITTIVCSRFASELDNTKTGNPPSIDIIGGFLTKVGDENALISIRSQLTSARIAKWELDLHPSWKFMRELNSLVSL